ncbi:MAG: reverse transcriptase/ribonuclease H family protein, partial [bacterium]
MPELSRQKHIQWKCHLDESTDPKTASYDMIMGRDLINALGLILDFKMHTITWDDLTVPMKERGEIGSSEAAKSLYHMAMEPQSIIKANCRAQRILDAKYEAANLTEVVKSKGSHLTAPQWQQLLTLLTVFKHLFDGTLGKFDTEPVELELKDNAKPYHAKPFAVPKVYEETLRKEVERLVSIGVLEKCGPSEWASPTFIIPKKNGTVRFISDFRQLNARLKRKSFPLPKISDLMQKLEGFLYATALDLNMGYFTIRLNPDAQRYCTIVLPWGTYKYLRLPLGVANSPDIFQDKMSDLMIGLEFVRTYLDDLLVITKASFEDHLLKLRLVLQRLSDAGLRVNVSKSNFCQTEIEYLGFLITQQGIQPLPNKVEAIKKIARPKNRKELRRFIGLVNYYRDMWRHRSDLLAPLSTMTSKNVRWKWTQDAQDAFDKIKRIVCQDVLLSYPDFSKPFHIYTDASGSQLGAVITQESNTPLAFYSRKLNSAQRLYTTTERVLLSIVETLKEFKNILLGQQLVVFTDHKNLIHNTPTTDRVMRWRLLLEEYAPEIKYIKGANNLVADALSRLATDE